MKYDSFIITMCIEGDCNLRVRSTNYEVSMRQGFCALIPAAIADYDVIPQRISARLLDVFIDNDNNLTGKVTRLMHVIYRG